MAASARSYKWQKSEDEDMISNLPDVLLQHILSFLPMDCAVRTSILSKRWEYIWVSLPNLTFELYNEDDMNFVDRALLLRNSTVKMFSLVCDMEEPFAVDGLRLKRWITAVVKRNVEELDLSLSDAMNVWFRLPYCLFTCASLTSLSLSMCCNFKCPLSVNLSTLKDLVLENVNFRDAESVDSLFTGCPILEKASLLQCNFLCSLCVFAPKLYELSLLQSKFLRSLRVSAPKLYELKISEYAYNYERRTSDVMITGASLKSFHLEGEFVASYCLDDLPALDEAVINICNACEIGWKRFIRILGRLLKGISHVKKLSLSPGTIEALNHQRNLLPEIPVFNNLSILSLSNYYHKAIELDDCTGLMKILQNSPRLETLRFEEGVIHSGDCKKYKRILKPVPPCFMSCLKRLEILFDNTYTNLELCMNAATVLLKRAVVLEKFIVYFPEGYLRELVYEQDLIKGLSELPRASKVCQIELVDYEMKLVHATTNSVN